MTKQSVFFFLLVSCSASAPESFPTAPDGNFSLLITNATVFGLRAGEPGAVALRDHRIVAVGTASNLEPLCQGACVRYDAQGKYLMPGFHDAHIHVYGAGEGAYELQVSGSSVSRVQAALSAYA